MSHFDALAPDYDRLRPAGEEWQELAERALAALEGTRRLLDVGCGTGRFAVLASERLGARVTLHVVDGADHSFGVLKRSGRSDAEVLDELADSVAGWCRRLGIGSGA